MTIINLTPHAVVMHAHHGQVVTIEPTGTVARCAVVREHLTYEMLDYEGQGWQRAYLGVEGEPNEPWVYLYRNILGPVEGLPGRVRGTRYIVSRLVAEACPDRDDLIYPDDLVRDGEGRVTGCRAFGVAYIG